MGYRWPDKTVTHSKNLIKFGNMGVRTTIVGSFLLFLFSLGYVNNLKIIELNSRDLAN